MLSYEQFAATRAETQMARPSQLSGSAITNALEEESLAGWSVRDAKLRRNFEFPDFVSAFGFMTQSALVAEKLDHHPEWSNVYNRVEIALTTHDAGGITSLDLELARAMNRLADMTARADDSSH